MAAERGHFDLHERVQGERIQDVVQFGRAFDVEHADVCELSRRSAKGEATFFAAAVPALARAPARPAV